MGSDSGEPLSVTKHQYCFPDLIISTPFIGLSHKQLYISNEQKFHCLPLSLLEYVVTLQSEESVLDQPDSLSDSAVVPLLQRTVLLLVQPVVHGKCYS